MKGLYLRHTRFKHTRLVLLLVIVTMLVLLAACDSAAEDGSQDTESQSNQDSGLPNKSSGDEVSDGSSNSVTSSANVDSIDSGETLGEDSQQLSVSNDADLGTSLIELDPGSVDVDINGVTVGFTTDGHPFRGDPTAPVLIEEYSDFQCPYCSRFFKQTLSQLDANQFASGEALLVYYDFPLTRSHPQAIAAANAARCAGEQGAVNYWLMHDLLFQNPSEWSNQNHNDTFLDYAENIGLELADFSQCISESRYDTEINSDLNDGAAQGISGTPSFIINGELLVGAQPVEVFNAAISAIGEGGTLKVTDSNPPPSQPQPAVAPTPAAFSDGYAGSLGDPNAPVTIVEFTDYQCPYCSRHSLETMPQIVRDMVDTGRVYYILKDFPLDSIHSEARQAAVAARCGAEQESYWEMHDLIFANQGEWSGKGDGANTLFTNYAATAGLDEQSFSSCLESGRHDLAVEANAQEGRSLGVSGTPHFFVDGYPLNGARPIEHFVAAVSLAEEGRLAEAFTPPEESTPGPAEIPTTDAFSIGEPDAPVTIIEYTDFQCPFCSRHYQQTYPQIVDQYVNTGLVRYVFKDFPLTQLHPQAIQAAESARCALDQGAYLEMHDIIFARQQEWSGSDPIGVFTGYAGQLGLDADEFRNCLTSNKYEQAVVADLQEGSALGVTGTPSFFINGYSLTGAQPFEVFQQAIDSLLQDAE